LRIVGDERMMTDITIKGSILHCNAALVNIGVGILTYTRTED